MGKATVEGSLRIDAHHWATPTVKRTAETLVSLLAQAKARIRAGEALLGTGLAETGLVDMQWTRGADQSPAGSIRWGALAEDGGKIDRLLLLFTTTHAGQPYPRRQEVGLDWHTAAGRPSRRPVLLCPFCGRRCRYLCAAYPGRQGGPYAGEFACRTCAGLCYAQQLEYKSAWAKGFDMVFRLQAKAALYPERLTEGDLARAEAATMAARSFGPRLDRLLRTAEAETEAEGPEKPRPWDVLPPPVFTPPKRRGRPSGKRQREQARACARIVREAEKEAKPKRPRGRPKERRAYDAAGRAEGGCAGRLGPEEGYCVSCRAGRRMVEAVPFTARNGRGGVKGKCEGCGRGLYRLGAMSPPPALIPPAASAGRRSAPERLLGVC